MTEPTTVDTSAAAIAALLDGVTPGPWAHGVKWDSVVAGNATGHDDQDTIDAYGGNLVCESVKRPPNQRFIAAARDLVPALSAKLTAETARANAAEIRLDNWRNNFRTLEAAVVGDTGLSAMLVATQAMLFKPRCEKAEAERDALRDRVAALEAALRFYDGHHKDPNEGPWGVNSTDFGAIARAATEGKPL